MQVTRQGTLFQREENSQESTNAHRDMGNIR